MSTNIQVDVALASLLARLKAQQNAQRLAFLQKQEQLSFEEQVAQALRQQLPPELVPQQKREPRKEDLAAFRNPATYDVELAIAWLRGDRLYCGDGSTYVTVASPSVSVSTQDPVNLANYSSLPPSCETIVTTNPLAGPNLPQTSAGGGGFSVVLPAGRDKLVYVTSGNAALAVFYYAYYSKATWNEFSGDVGGSCELPYVVEGQIIANWRDGAVDNATGAYLVSRTSAIEISASTLISIVAQQHVAYKIVNSLAVPFAFPGYPPYLRAEVELSSNPVTGQFGYYGNYSTRLTSYGSSQASVQGAVTPMIFQTLGANLDTFGFDISKADDYSLIDSIYVTSACPFVFETIDPASNGGRYEANLYAKPFKVGSSVVDGGGLGPPAKRVTITPWNRPSNLDEFAEPLVAWDWGVPAYCRASLADFGVSV